MVSYMARDGYYMAYAIGTDLTAWRNADAALIVTEINAMDWFISANITHTKPKAINVNPMSSSHYPKRVGTGRTRGSFSNTHFLQTAILTYMVMGGSTAVAAETERDITKDTNETPINTAFHLEKEGTTANRRKDILGIVPQRLSISCNERDWVAKQTYTGEFALTGSGGDLAQPTALTQSAHPPYTWGHYKHGTSSSAFLYNDGAINVEIIGFTIDFGWSGATFGTFDTNGYPATGLYNPPFTTRINIECKYVDGGGTDIQAISDLAHDAYAGDLDLIIEFYEDATNYLEYTFDDLMVDPDSFQETFVSEDDWFDGFSFDLVFRNETSSLAVKSMDALADTYYTNP